MNEIKRVIRVCLIILAVGFYMAAIYYLVAGITGNNAGNLLPAVLYLVAGLTATGFERMFEVA